MGSCSRELLASRPRNLFDARTRTNGIPRFMSETVLLSWFGDHTTTVRCHNGHTTALQPEGFYAFKEAHTGALPEFRCAGGTMNAAPLPM